MEREIEILIDEHEKELEIIKKSFEKNSRTGMIDIARKRGAQAVLVERFIKDLKNLLK